MLGTMESQAGTGMASSGFIFHDQPRFDKRIVLVGVSLDDIEAYAFAVKAFVVEVDVGVFVLIRMNEHRLQAFWSLPNGQLQEHALFPSCRIDTLDRTPFFGHPYPIVRAPNQFPGNHQAISDYTHTKHG